MLAFMPIISLETLYFSGYAALATASWLVRRIFQRISTASVRSYIAVVPSVIGSRDLFFFSHLPKIRYNYMVILRRRRIKNED